MSAHSKYKVLHVMEFSGRCHYIEINEPAWKKLTEKAEVKDGTVSGWFVDRDLLSRMLGMSSEYPHFEVIGDFGRPEHVDYHVVFSNSDMPKNIHPFERFK